jgi:hypothetical protein
MTDITDKPINDFEEIIGDATGKPTVAGYRCKLCGDSARYQSLIWHKYGCKHAMTEPKPEKQESVFDGTTYTSSIKELNEKIKAEPLSEQVLYLAEGINAYLGTLSKELKNMEDSATAGCDGTHNVVSSASLGDAAIREDAEGVSMAGLGSLVSEACTTSPARLIAEIEALRQSAEGSQIVESVIATDAYNEAIDDVIELIRNHYAASSATIAITKNYKKILADFNANTRKE